MPVDPNARIRDHRVQLGVPPFAAGWCSIFGVRWALEVGCARIGCGRWISAGSPPTICRELPSSNQCRLFATISSQIIETGANVQYIGEQSEDPATARKLPPRLPRLFRGLNAALKSDVF
jgi:hypothetical protein